jgi:hypothetical protein
MGGQFPVNICGMIRLGLWGGRKLRMAKDSDKRAGSFETGNTGGFISGFLAEEDEFDRRKLWRLGSWAAASVGAVIVALLASQTSMGLRHEQIAVADLARQSLQIQSVAKESQGEARRLASAIDTLNSDRDRLYSRVAVLEQGLDSVTGAVARQNPPLTSPQAASPAASPVTSAAPAPAVPVLAAPVLAAPGPAASAEPPATAQKPSPAPVVSPVAATTATTAEKPPVVVAAAEPGPAPASSGAQAASNAPTGPAATPPTPLVALKSMMAPPDPAAGKLFEPSPPSKTITAAPMPEVLASSAPAEDAIEADTAAPKLAVQRTEFGVDVGGANSLPGLRALWRGLLKSRSNVALTKLRPIIVIKEGSNGLGMQLRLVAGPINDAAAAADVCAVIIENDRACVMTVFEGQRLAMNADEPTTGADGKPPAADIKPGSAAKPGVHRHYTLKRTAEPAPKPEPSNLSRMFGTR